ncbi:hypothetical protein BOY45_004272 [Shigella flexneri]|nr:hypothetical protein [Shigella flexneri]
MNYPTLVEIFIVGGDYMELSERLKPYCDALVKGMEDENWYLALMAAFTLPDICTSLEGKTGKESGPAYIKWFDDYVTQYRIPKGRKNAKVTNLPDGGTVTSWKKSDPVLYKPFFSGVNAYALRCTFLHSGGGEVATQPVYKGKSEDVLLGIKKVKFIKHLTNLHTEQTDNTIRLNPRHYCQAILDGVDEWIDSIQKDNKRKQKVLYYTKNLIIFE